MLGTGIVRRIDDLGRIVIPKEIRRRLNITEGDPLELSLGTCNQDKPVLCLTKYTGNDGRYVLKDFITRLEGIRRDLYSDVEKETANKITTIIKLLNENKDKFDF